MLPTATHDGRPLLYLRASVVVLLALGANTSSALNPNYKDRYGALCPLFRREGLVCPQLCVRSLEYCPNLPTNATTAAVNGLSATETASREWCGENKRLCEDGRCRNSCHDVINPCLCRNATSSFAAQYVACPSLAGTVAIDSYNASKGSEQLREACNAKWNLTAVSLTSKGVSLDGGVLSAVPVLNATVTEPWAWSECRSQFISRLEYTEWYFLVAYAMVGHSLLWVSAWHIYKAVAEHRQRISSAAVTQVCGPTWPPSRFMSLYDLRNHSKFTFTGYADSLFGTATWAIYAATTGAWILFFWLMVLIHFNLVGGNHWILFDSQVNNLVPFLVTWCLTFLWLLLAIITSRRTKSYFRLKSSLGMATHIKIDSIAAHRDASAEPWSRKGGHDAGPPRPSNKREKARDSSWSSRVSALEKGAKSALTQWWKAPSFFSLPHTSTTAPKACGKCSLFRRMADWLGLSRPHTIVRVQRTMLRKGDEVVTWFDYQGIHFVLDSSTGEFHASYSFNMASLLTLPTAKSPIKDLAILDCPPSDLVSECHYATSPASSTHKELSASSGGTAAAAPSDLNSSGIASGGNLSSAMITACSCSGGLTHTEANRRLYLVGKNRIEEHQKGLAAMVWTELTNRVFVEQWILLWCWQFMDLWQLTVILLITIPLSAVLTIWVEYRSRSRHRWLAGDAPEWQVLRQGSWQRVSEANLVPGDLVEVRQGGVLNWDGVLIRGNLAIDESQMTGSTIPQYKIGCEELNATTSSEGPRASPLSRSSSSVFGIHCDMGPASCVELGCIAKTALGCDIDGRCKLWAGSHIMQAHESTCSSRAWPASVSLGVNTASSALAIVTSTRYASARSFGRPPEIHFKRRESEWLFQFDDIRSFTPISLLGQGLLFDKISTDLRRLGIYYSRIHRILVAGKVNVVAFDKTGTLTNGQMELHMVIPTVRIPASCARQAGYLKFGQPVETAHGVPGGMLLVGMGLCHQDLPVDNKWPGTGLDMVLAQAAGWQYQPPRRSGGTAQTTGPGEECMFDYYPRYIPPPTTDGGSGGSEYVVVARFPFDPYRRTMSVIAVDTSTCSAHLFVKGSPASVIDCCHRNGTPFQWAQSESEWAAKGYTTLAMAHRDLGLVTDAESLLRLTRMQAQDRDALERGCECFALFVLKDALRSDTGRVINTLRRWKIRSIMVTGDAPFTALHIAKQASIVSQDAEVYVGNSVVAGQVVWTNTRTQAVDMDLPTRISGGRIPIVAHGADAHCGKEYLGDIELVVTSPVMNHLIKAEEIVDLLPFIRVYAGMSPADKAQISQLHRQKLPTSPPTHGGSLVVDGATTHKTRPERRWLWWGGNKEEKKRRPKHRKFVFAYVGDSVSDYGGLDSAHLGVLLRFQRQSVPPSSQVLTSINASIMAIYELVRHGKAALATSYALYLYMLVYALQLVQVKIYSDIFGPFLSKWSFIFFHFLYVIPLAIGVSLSGPASPNVFDAAPAPRELGSLTTLRGIVYCTIYLTSLICMHFILASRDWFQCRAFDARATNSPGWEQPNRWSLYAENYESSVTTILLFGNVLTAANLLNLGDKWRQPWYKNISLLCLTLLLGVPWVVVAVAPPNFLGCLLEVNCGNPEALARLGYRVPAGITRDYSNNPSGHNVLPAGFRAFLLAYVAATFGATIFVEQFMIRGLVGRVLTNWWGQLGASKLHVFKP